MEGYKLIFMGVMLAIFAGALANIKGRGVLNWVLLSLLLGPLALIILLFLPKQKDCPQCLTNKHVRKTLIEDGSVGYWCDNCEKSFQAMGLA